MTVCCDKSRQHAGNCYVKVCLSAEDPDIVLNDKTIKGQIFICACYILNIILYHYHYFISLETKFLFSLF